MYFFYWNKISHDQLGYIWLKICCLHAITRYLISNINSTNCSYNWWHFFILFSVFLVKSYSFNNTSAFTCTQVLNILFKPLWGIHFVCAQYITIIINIFCLHNPEIKVIVNNHEDERLHTTLTCWSNSNSNGNVIQ